MRPDLLWSECLRHSLLLRQLLEESHSSPLDESADLRQVLRTPRKLFVVLNNLTESRAAIIDQTLIEIDALQREQQGTTVFTFLPNNRAQQLTAFFISSAALYPALVSDCHVAKLSGQSFRQLDRFLSYLIHVVPPFSFLDSFTSRPKPTYYYVERPTLTRKVFGALPRAPANMPGELTVEPRTAMIPPVMNWRERITSDPQVLRGKPCIKDTRIPVALVLGYLAAGRDAAAIVREFPDLKTEDVSACLNYARDLAEFTGAAA